jgi:8-oxo-dGDP phosphatase
MRALETRQVYANQWMIVREDVIRRADGSDGIYGVVDKPWCAVVVPWDGARFMLVEQYRYPVGARRWEFPQGTAPQRAELDPVLLAARELREETGLTASRLDPLGTLDVAPGMSSQRGRVYLATGLTEGPPQREPEEQDMRCAWFDRAELERMITGGTLADAQTLAAYALFLLRVPGGR